MDWRAAKRALRAYLCGIAGFTVALSVVLLGTVLWDCFPIIEMAIILVVTPLILLYLYYHTWK